MPATRSPSARGTRTPRSRGPTRTAWAIPPFATWYADHAGIPPTLFVADTDSLGEQIQLAFPQARVARPLNTVTAALMTDPGPLPEPTTIVVCGDESAAKGEVARLLAQLGHTEIIDLGGIETARGTEMYLPSICAPWGPWARPCSTSGWCADGGTGLPAGQDVVRTRRQPMGTSNSWGALGSVP